MSRRRRLKTAEKRIQDRDDLEPQRHSCRLLVARGSSSSHEERGGVRKKVRVRVRGCSSAAKR